MSEITREHAALRKCLTVDELIEELKKLPGDQVVGFATGYGDYGRTTQFLPVRKVRHLDNEVIEETAYSNSGLRIYDYAKHTDELPEPMSAIVLE